MRLLLPYRPQGFKFVQTQRFLHRKDISMGNKKICKKCGREFDPDDTRENNRCGDGYHPEEAVEVGESGDPRYD